MKNCGSVLRGAALRGLTLALALLVAASESGPANARSLTEKDVQILAKAIGFLEPPPSGVATIAIAYDASNPDSKRDAGVIAGYFGEGLQARRAILKAKPTAVADLGAWGFIAVIPADGLSVDQFYGAMVALHAACITADAAMVESGRCVMSVRSDPKVEISVNRAAAANCGIVFGSAFLLMARVF